MRTLLDLVPFSKPTIEAWYATSKPGTNPGTIIEAITVHHQDGSGQTYVRTYAGDWQPVWKDGIKFQDEPSGYVDPTYWDVVALAV